MFTVLIIIVYLPLSNFNIKHISDLNPKKEAFTNYSHEKCKMQAEYR